MWGILLIVVLLVVVYLWWAGKLNVQSLNESSPSFGQSSDSVQVDPETNQLNVKLNSGRVSYVRIAHNDNKFSQVYVADKPLSFNEIVDEGKNRVGTNCVFVGTVFDSGLRLPRSSTSTASTSTNVLTTKTTANFDIKEYKSMFIVFKNTTPTKITDDDIMMRLEVDNLTVCLIDVNTPLSERELRDLRKLTSPVLVYTKNATAQQLLLEYGFTPINSDQSAYLKNQKSYREMN
ncbi:odv-e25 [Catopsilia pomona nucleopolyhedrovirus]|uniref:Odv-e25 n=1 Tax=Catopsilia pomona nucleopolyhedrovirus TaxID=1850906 RepID=A0A172WZC5_9ABAC|nr:odv-e25 [Catopsilia pomona nucleopolyhedrovirus]ANF29699.1 odv-e25 [Catopsilia pomona nucleopolyhedrovirus]